MEHFFFLKYLLISQFSEEAEMVPDILCEQKLGRKSY